MTNAVISPKPKFTAIDANGDPYVGAKLYTYETGTTTPKTTWTDATKSTPNTNPIILDSFGQADVWIDPADGAYRFKLDDADDVTLWTKDGVTPLEDWWSDAPDLDSPVKGDKFLLYDTSAAALAKLTISDLYGNVYYPDHSETDQGVSGNTIKAAVDAIGSDMGTIILRHNSGSATTSYTLTTSETIPSNIKLIIQNGAVLDGAGTLTINGPFEGVDGCFGSSITVSFGTGAIKEAYPEWWGAKGDGSNDDTTAIQAALDTGKEVILLNKTYLISSSLFIPAYGSLKGVPYAKIEASAGTYTGDYMILYNSTDGSTWVTSYINSKNKDNISNLTIQALVGLTIKGVFLAGTSGVRNLKFIYTKTAVTGSSNYNDSITIDSITAGSDCDPDNYQIYINQLGDALRISQCSINNQGKGIYVAGSFGGGIFDCVVNGEIRLDYCSAFTISNLHCEEYPHIYLVNSDCSIEDSIIYKRAADTYTPIEASSTTDERHFLSLRDVSIAYYMDEAFTNYYDLKLHSNYYTTIYNCYKKLVESGTISRSNFGGIIIQDENDAAITDWNNFSYALSRYSEIKNASRIDKIISNTQHFGTAYIMNPTHIGLSAHVTWRASTGTYYYKAIALSDIGRLTGKIDTYAEGSIAVTNGGSGVYFILGSGTTNSSTIIRVYRGTSTGSYDKYVDIHRINTYIAYDDGDNCNGFEWKARGAAGVDSINSIYEYYLDSISAVVTMNAAPTVGTWAVGDKVWTKTPAGGASPGWICVTAGTPGTWKAMADLAP